MYKQVDCEQLCMPVTVSVYETTSSLNGACSSASGKHGGYWAIRNVTLFRAV